jgi:SAM-dependent methyltransferase
MRNRDKWQPSKYIYKNNKLIASRDRKEVGVSSRLMADSVANLYGKHLRKYAKGSLLDLGCGKVPLYIAYKDLVSDTTCVDWVNTQHDNKHLDLECDLTNKLPFLSGEFDTVILSDVLEHILTPAKLLKEICRVLSKDGKLIMNVPFYYWLHEQPFDYYRFTEFALRSFVEDAGLKTVKLETLGGTPEILTDIISKNLCSIPKIGPLFALFAQWCTSFFVRTKIGKTLSKYTSSQFPFGYFLIAEKCEDI